MSPALTGCRPADHILQPRGSAPCSLPRPRSSQTSDTHAQDWRGECCTHMCTCASLHQRVQSHNEYSAPQPPGTGGHCTRCTTVLAGAGMCTCGCSIRPTNLVHVRRLSGTSVVSAGCGAGCLEAAEHGPEASTLPGQGTCQLLSTCVICCSGFCHTRGHPQS